MMKTRDYKKRKVLETEDIILKHTVLGEEWEEL